MSAALAIDKAAIAAFCRKWKIIDLSLFGSVLREDFNSDSDIDVLATFADEVSWSLLDNLRMEEELTTMFARRVDLISRAGLRRSHNWIRRDAILESAEKIYAA